MKVYLAGKFAVENTFWIGIYRSLKGAKAAAWHNYKRSGRPIRAASLDWRFNEKLNEYSTTNLANGYDIQVMELKK